MNARNPLERDLVKCEDMRIHAENARKFLADRTLEDFYRDEMAQAAIIRCIAVIGEAARLVSDTSRSRTPEIPWSLIIGMRNVLIHDYGTIDIDKIFEVVTSFLPSLLDSLIRLISELEREVNWSDRT